MRETKKIFCNDCDKEVKGERETEKINHILHLLLTIICGLISFFNGYGFIGGFIWLVMWILISLSQQSKKYQCSVCGSDNIKLLRKDRIKENIKNLIVGGIILFFTITYFKNDYKTNQTTIPTEIKTTTTTTPTEIKTTTTTTPTEIKK